MATVTVLSGPERRRRWASSEKASIVEESLRPGAVVTAVARRHDVHPNLLQHWRRQAKRGLEGGAVTAQQIWDEESHPARPAGWTGRQAVISMKGW